MSDPQLYEKIDGENGDIIFRPQVVINPPPPKPEFQEYHTEFESFDELEDEWGWGPAAKVEIINHQTYGECLNWTGVDPISLAKTWDEPVSINVRFIHDKRGFFIFFNEDEWYVRVGGRRNISDGHKYGMNVSLGFANEVGLHEPVTVPSEAFIQPGGAFHLEIQELEDSVRVYLLRESNNTYLHIDGRWRATVGPVIVYEKERNAESSVDFQTLENVDRHNVMSVDIVEPVNKDGEESYPPPGDIPKFDDTLFPEFPVNPVFPHTRLAFRADGTPIDEEGIIPLVDYVPFGGTGEEVYNQIEAINPECLRLVYTLATFLSVADAKSWNVKADDEGWDREEAFFHANKPDYYGIGTEDSPFQAAKFNTLVHSGQWHTGNRHFDGPRNGNMMWMGKPDPFHKVHIQVDNEGVPGIWHYGTSKDENGILSTSPIPQEAIVSDTTNGGSKTGTLEIDYSVIKDSWIPGYRADGATPIQGSMFVKESYLYCLAVKNESSIATVYDYVRTDNPYRLETGETRVPQFDSEADLDGDGFLSPSERLLADPEKRAVFKHWSRMPKGEGSFYLNLLNDRIAEWVIDRGVQLCLNRDAGGIFWDVADPGINYDEVSNAEWQDAQGKIYRESWERLRDARPGRRQLVQMNVSGWAPEYNYRLVQWLPCINEDRTMRMNGSWKWFERDENGHWQRHLNQRGGMLHTTLDSLGGDQFCLDEDYKMGWYCYHMVRTKRPHIDGFLSGGFNADTGGGRSKWEERHFVPAIIHPVGLPLGRMETVYSYDYDVAGRPAHIRLYKREYELGTFYYLPCGEYVDGSYEAVPRDLIPQITLAFGGESKEVVTFGNSSFETNWTFTKAGTGILVKK